MRSSLYRIARQQFQAGNRRFASTTQTNAQQAAEKASAVATASAARARDAAIVAANKAVVLLGRSGETLTRLASTTGGRTGGLLKAIEAGIPTAVYYSKVAFEVSKIVFHGQKMTPPDLATFQSTILALLSRQTITSVRHNAITALRSASARDLAATGVILAEILGFFTVGEIIGRRKLVGYRGQTSSHH